MTTKTYPFNMRLPIATLEKIKKEATQKGICYTALVKMIVTEYFNKKENKKDRVCE